MTTVETIMKEYDNTVPYGITGPTKNKVWWCLNDDIISFLETSFT